MKNEKKNQVVFLGEANTGKTCLINRLVKDDYNPDYRSTFCSYQSIYKGNEFTFDIFDTAGQEKFRSLNKIFYKNAKVVILVYDITNRKTFDELEKYWYSEVEHLKNNSSIYRYNNFFSNLCSWK